MLANLFFKNIPPCSALLSPARLLNFWNIFLIFCQFDILYLKWCYFEDHPALLTYLVTKEVKKLTFFIERLWILIFYEFCPFCSIIVFYFCECKIHRTHLRHSKRLEIIDQMFVQLLWLLQKYIWDFFRSAKNQT